LLYNYDRGIENTRLDFGLAALQVTPLKLASGFGIFFIRGAGAAKAIAPVEKFSAYIFKEGATHGKDPIFRGLGYEARHSEALAATFAEQAGQKFSSGQFTLGKLDQFGQRINIEIELSGIGQAAGKTSFIQSGWMMLENGSIKLNTPFAGFTR
jgi:hypothetical protein